MRRKYNKIDSLDSSFMRNIGGDKELPDDIKEKIKFVQTFTEAFVDDNDGVYDVVEEFSARRNAWVLRIKSDDMFCTGGLCMMLKFALMSSDEFSIVPSTEYTLGMVIEFVVNIQDETERQGT